MASQVTTEVTPPVLYGPTSKERKYDRQLRLWAANGQAALEEAHILLINSGPGVVGIETLKNLVLPGAGHFTILDHAVVEEEDLGVNFFLVDEDVGRSRAEACTERLQELNPDVKGYADHSPVEQFLSQSGKLSPYTLILVTLPLAPELLEIVSEHAPKTAVPVFYIHSIGFYSHFTVQLPPAFPIVDTHPDPVTTNDLRLLNPWPELLTLAEEKTAGLESMDQEQHGHVPYLLLLLHYLEQWKSEHNGNVPQNYNEKTAFRDLVRKGEQTNYAEGGEENYEEAIGAVLKTINPATVSSAVKEVFNAPECQNLTPTSSEFWLIAHAISDFYKHHGVLPLPGSLPDMKAKSADYIQLQNIYKTKARNDVAEVAERVKALATQTGIKQEVPYKEIESFCKSAGHIRLVRGQPPHIAKPQNVPKWHDRASYAVSQLTTPDSLMSLYIAFLAYDSYAASHGMVNQMAIELGQQPTEDPDTEAAKLTGIAHTFVDALISEAGSLVEDPEYSEMKDSVRKIVEEMVRAGGGELHNIAAATGGMIAQEVIKVITKQYIPVDNTCVFDGITSRTSVLRL